MDVIRLASPAPRLREYVRFYAHREVRIGGTTVVHPVPARACPLVELVFGEPFQVLYPNPSRVTEARPPSLWACKHIAALNSSFKERSSVS
jgi:hypothetical protein